jgi:hypothetical protein
MQEILIKIFCQQGKKSEKYVCPVQLSTPILINTLYLNRSSSLTIPSPESGAKYIYNSGFEKPGPKENSISFIVTGDICVLHERKAIYQISKLISNPYINKHKMQILIKIPNEWVCTQEVVKFIILLQFQITLQYNTKIIEACRKKVEKI